MRVGAHVYRGPATKLEGRGSNPLPSQPKVRRVWVVRHALRQVRLRHNNIKLGIHVLSYQLVYQGTRLNSSLRGKGRYAKGLKRKCFILVEGDGNQMSRVKDIVLSRKTLRRDQMFYLMSRYRAADPFGTLFCLGLYLK